MVGVFLFSIRCGIYSRNRKYPYYTTYSYVFHGTMKTEMNDLGTNQGTIDKFIMCTQRDIMILKTCFLLGSYGYRLGTKTMPLTTKLPGQPDCAGIEAVLPFEFFTRMQPSIILVSTVGI